jgi:hypothetical protein
MLMSGSLSGCALSGQPQMAERLPIQAFSNKPSPVLSSQPMLMSRSLSGCALSGQPQMAEPLPIQAFSDKPSPALSGQPMLMSRSLSGCALSGQTSLAMVRLGSCLCRNQTHLRVRQCTRPRATQCVTCMVIQVAARTQAQH